MQLSGRSFVSRFVTLSVALLAGLSFAGSAAQAQAPSLLPYTSKLIAGGGVATYAAGVKCPSGYTSTDAYGDGCLATEIELGNNAAGAAKPGARSAVADSAGNVFFTDYNNGLIRRIDALTGIVTAVAGGASSSPAAGTACGLAVSIDARGDGCLGTAVKLGLPVGLAFAPNGDLYFTDYSYSDVRKIAATNGFITTTGIITNIAGTTNTTGTVYGYAANNASGNIVAATQSYLDAPYGLAFDKQGDLFIAEEYKEAILVVNLNATGSTTVNGVTIPAGTIAKIAGTSTVSPYAGTPYCPNGNSGTNGCSYGKYTDGSVANMVSLDAPYDVAVDTTGNVYIANEYYNTVPFISPSGVLTTYAGSLSSEKKEANTVRGAAGSFGIGSTVGTAVDLQNNLYLTDSTAGIIWRVDATTLAMYAVAGGSAATITAGSPCPSSSSFTATDSYGDGCPGLQTVLGANGTTYSSFTLPGPGVFHVSSDAYENIYFGDTETNLIREIASGTQFGPVGANAPTNIVDVHFAVNDGPAASSPYVISASQPANSFSLGTANCTTNSDNTMDCLLPLTATPSVLGAFTGTLTVTSSLGKTASFPLSGTYVQSPTTRTTISAVAAGACAGSTTYSTTTTITLTATVISTGTPTGKVQFYNNGVALGSAVNVTNGVATLAQTFPAGSYSITATYSGDTYFTTSTSSAAKFSTSLATFYFGTVSANQLAAVNAGQTALYSFTLASSVYTGTLTFACSGLPAGAACVFSPSSISATGCSLTGTTAPTIAMNITTSAPANVIAEGFGSGNGALRLVTVLSGVLLALMIGLRRRRMSAALATLGMMAALLLASTGLTACSATVSDHSVATPSGTYPITVTVLGSIPGNTPPVGSSTTLGVTLKVN